jgi:putative peptidoglycan lipid II flippase
MPATAESNSSAIKRSITVASVIMMASVFLSRVLGVVREMVLGSYAGTGSAMDSYVAAFLLPEIVNHLLAGGFMSVTFIPIFQKHIAAGRRDLAWKAFSNLVTTGSLIIAAVTCVCLFYTENILGLMGKHITNPEQLALTTRMTRIILPAQIFFYWGALLMAVQYAEKRFFIPALAPLIYNAGIILGGVILSPWLGIEGFAWGVLGGSIVGNFLVQAWGARSSGMQFKLRVNLADPDLCTYILVTLPLVIGLGMQFSNEIFFRYFGSFLGEGGLASLNYSLRTMMALVAVFGQAFGVAAFPFLSQYVAEKRYGQMNSLLFSMLTKVAVFMVPFSLLMMALSHESLGLLFQRGKFTAASTDATAPVLIMYCIGAFAMAATNMLSRGFYAVQNTVLPMVVSSIAAFSSLPFYWIFLHSNGAPGIALVGSLFMLVQSAALLAIWTRHYQGGTELKQFLLALQKIVLISALGCALCLGILFGLKHFEVVQQLRPLLRNLFLLAACGTPAVFLTFFLFDRWGLADVRSIVKRVLRKKA